MTKLPERTADTMSHAIALSSPNGRMSKRARETAQKQLSIALFGAGGLRSPGLPPQPTKREKYLREAAQCRELAARGMRPRAFIRQAEMLEALANGAIEEARGNA